jgi:hypothetical protein
MRQVWTRKFLSLGPARSASHFSARAAMTCSSDAPIAHNEPQKRETSYLTAFYQLCDYFRPDAATGAERTSGERP